jgi:hypothetical protein
LIPLFTTEEPVTLPLAADPALQRQAGSAAAISAYLADSDVSELAALDLSDVTTVTIRALSESELSAAGREPGLMPKLGHQVALDERSWHELSDDEKAALDAYSEWERSWRMAYVRRGVVEFAGYRTTQATAAIESIQPDRLRSAVILELFTHIHHVSNLGIPGKAPSPPASGKAKPRRASPGGSAKTAQASGGS